MAGTGGPRWSERVVEAIVVPAVLVLVGVGFASIVLRYVSGGAYAFFWAEEVIRYGFVWVFWIVAPVTVRRGVAFSVDLVTQHLAGPVRAWVALAGNLGVALLFAVYVLEGARMVVVNWSQLSTALEIRMSWAYLAIPVGAAAVLWEAVHQGVNQLRALAPVRRRETAE